MTITKKQKIIMILLILGVFLIFLDYFLTLAGVNKGGLVMEGNPIVKELLTMNFGWIIWLSVFKLIL